MAISACQRSAKSRAPTGSLVQQGVVLPRMDYLGGRLREVDLTSMKGRGSSSHHEAQVLMLNPSCWKSSTASSGMMTQEVRAELPESVLTPAKLAEEELGVLDGVGVRGWHGSFLSMIVTE